MHSVKLFSTSKHIVCLLYKSFILLWYRYYVESIVCWTIVHWKIRRFRQYIGNGDSEQTYWAKMLNIFSVHLLLTIVSLLYTTSVSAFVTYYVVPDDHTISSANTLRHYVKTSERYFTSDVHLQFLSTLTNLCLWPMFPIFHCVEFLQVTQQFFAKIQNF